MPWRWILPTALAFAAAPLLVAFTRQPGLASLGDDSASYLVLARWMSGEAGPLLAPWVSWHNPFPPVFPLLLALAGAGTDLARAHCVVALCAAASVGLLARYAALRFASVVAGMLLAGAFLVLPTAWISAKGILSEAPFLAITLAALIFHETRLGCGRGGRAAHLVFGLLLSAAILARAAGVALLAGYVACILLDVVARRDRRAVRWLPLVPPLVLQVAWMVVRPGGERTYGSLLSRAGQGWMRAPQDALQGAWGSFADGWIASFAASAEISGSARMLLFVLGAAALAGAFRAAARSRPDGWYVLIAITVAFVLPFGEDNSRRMLYPLVPLALIHAGEALRLAFSRLPRPGLLAGAALAIALLPSVPALVLVAEKYGHRAPLVAGSPYSAAEITEYYTTINVARARQAAARHAAVLGGLARLQADTPHGARIMWVRPEYVAILGHRPGVASYFHWDGARLAREVLDSGADFIVISGVYKSDLRQAAGDPALTLQQIADYTVARTVLVNPVSGDPEFLLMQVQRDALGAYIARTAAGGSR